MMRNIFYKMKFKYLIDVDWEFSRKSKLALNPFSL